MKKICMFWKALSQLRAYFQSKNTHKNGMAKIILNTKIDYPAFLRQTQIEEILSTSQNQANALVELSKWVTNEVKKDTKQRFTGLKKYFQDVASFNSEKAQADIAFIRGRLTDYQTDVTDLSGKLGGKLSKILNWAFAAVSAEAVENTAQVTLAGAVLMNPLEKLFGGGSAGAFMDRAAALANTLVKFGKLGRATRSFNDIKTRLTGMASKFNENGDFLDTINTLIATKKKDADSSDFEDKKKKFLSKYKEYDPKVKRPEIVAMTTAYGNLVDGCCDVINSLQTTAAATIKGPLVASGICPKTKEVAQKLFATLAEIYDFQFDLIEAMASYMSALTAHDAAQDINADYDRLADEKTIGKEVLDELKSLTKFAYITYKVNIWGISEAYCEILTYKAGGTPPSVCTSSGPKDIAQLVSVVSSTCRNTEAYTDVPISSETDQAFMNLTDVYAGNSVYFKIPSSQWLVDNNWISQSEKNSIIKVKKFEVFLPHQSTVPRLVRVNADVIGENKLSASSKVDYVIVPKKEFIFEYREGAGSEDACRQTSQILNNPYGPSYPKLCRLNVDENNCQEILQKTPLFPSIYAKWKITVDGYESSLVPKKPGNFKLKVGIRLCILRPSSSDIPANHKKKKHYKVKAYRTNWKSRKQP